MTHYTLTYVEGVVRCEDLEAMLFATAARMNLSICLETIPEYEDEDPCERDEEYDAYIDYLDYLEQGYD